MTDSKYTNFDYELSQKILTMLKVSGVDELFLKYAIYRDDNSIIEMQLTNMISYTFLIVILLQPYTIFYVVVTAESHFLSLSTILLYFYIILCNSIFYNCMLASMHRQVQTSFLVKKPGSKIKGLKLMNINLNNSVC